MSDSTENMDIFDMDLEKYKEKYNSVLDNADKEGFVDDLFESSDGTPVKNWSIEDINKLISEVDSIPDEEHAGEDFDFDRYEEYSEPESVDFGSFLEEEKEEVYDENAVYFSKEYEQDLASKTFDKEPTDFEDVSSVSEGYEEPEDFFEEAEQNDFTSVEGNINEARADGEFREIDETLDEDGFEQVEVVYDGTFDRGDYLKIKDIFKSSKVLSKRKAERAEVREAALENVKDKFGEDIFDIKKKEEDFDEILRRQNVVEQQKEEQRKDAPEKRFDIDSENYVVKAKPQPKEIEVDEEENLDDTIFIDGLSAFEQVARDSSQQLDEENSATKIIGDISDTQKCRNIYISPASMRQNDDQLRFEGFPEEELIPEEVSDEEVKETLRKTREEKKTLFRMTNLPSDYDDTDPNYFSPEKGKYDEEEYVVLSDENNPKSVFSILKNSFFQEKNKKQTEYSAPAEKPQVFKELYDRRRRSLFGLIAMGAMTLFIAIIQIVLGAIEAVPSGVQSAVVLSFSIIGLLSTFLLGSSVTQPGFKNMFRKTFGVDSSVTVIVLMSIISTIVMFFDLSNADEIFPIYTVVVMMCVIIDCLGRFFETNRAINALKITTTKRKNNLFTVQSIDDTDAAENIARIFAGSNPDLKYSCKTAFPSGFIFNSFSANPADRFTKLIFPIILVMSFLVAIIAGIVNKSIPFAFSSFMACILISYPVSVMMALNIALSSLNKKLEKKNACITGYTAVRNIDKTNAIVVDATDLFDVDKCNFHGMKDYGTVRVDDIILYAAAMLTNSRGPLAHVFDKAIIGDKSELLPEVENLCYEERLGLSGWIRGEKVFVGNRNLLINHNMEAPPKGAEVACLKEGKKVLYIAIDGKVAAMLVVEYAKNEKIKKHLSRLDKSGIAIVVATNDCNIDEDFLSLEFNMPRESFKVVGDFEGGLLDGFIHRMRKTATAKLVHDGTSQSFFETLTSAFSYSSSTKITLIIQAAISLISLIVTAIFAISGNLSMLSAGIMVIIQVVISALMTLFASIRAKS